jgi:Na+/H+-dicarboxylate symporter
MKSFQDTLTLTSDHIDQISARLQEYLDANQVAHRESLRLRLSVEETLLQWQKYLTPDAQCSVCFGKRLWRTFVQLEVKGAQVNPYAIQDPAFGDGNLPQNLLTGLGLAPSYDYVDGTNLLTLHPNRQKLNPMIPLLIAIVLGLLAGYFFNAVLDTPSQIILADKFLKPLFNTFMRLLSLVACMIVFFSVLWGVVNIGDLTFLGTVGKKMASRTFLWIYGSLVLTMFMVLGFYHLDLDAAFNLLGISEEIWKLLLDIIPGDFVTPFLKGNTLQLIFLAIGGGLIMLLLDRQVKETLTLVGQINIILQRAIGYIGTLTPFIVFVCILQLSVGSLKIPGGSLVKIFLLIWAVELVLPLLFTAYLARITRTSFFIIVKKILPIALVALSTASSTSVFGANMECTIHRLGVNEKLANLGVPLLQTMLKLGDAVNFFVLALCAAEIFQVPVSPAWLAIAFILSGLLSVACPPVAGGAATGLAIICLQLGLPGEALALCVTLAQLTDFSNTALNVWGGMTFLPIIADSLHLLDLEVLRN